MKKMIDLNKHDISKNFIVISNNDNRKNHLLSQYVGIDGYGENSHLTHKFCYSYTRNFDIYYGYYPISCHYILKSIDLPFDVLSIINQFIYEYN